MKSATFNIQINTARPNVEHIPDSDTPIYDSLLRKLAQEDAFYQASELYFGQSAIRHLRGLI